MDLKVFNCFFCSRLRGAGFEEGHPVLAGLQRHLGRLEAHRPEHGPLLQHQGSLSVGFELAPVAATALRRLLELFNR